MRIFGSEPLTVFKSNKDDPYVTVPDSDDESEKEDDVIRDTGGLCWVVMGCAIALCRLCY